MVARRQAYGLRMAENENGSYSRFGQRVAAHLERLGVNPNELDKRAEELAERAAVTVKARC